MRALLILLFVAVLGACQPTFTIETSAEITVIQPPVRAVEMVVCNRVSDLYRWLDNRQLNSYCTFERVERFAIRSEYRYVDSVGRNCSAQIVDLYSGTVTGYLPVTRYGAYPKSCRWPGQYW